VSEQTVNTPEDDLPEQLRIRRGKRAAIIERGGEAYPVAVPRTKSLKAVRDENGGLDARCRYWQD
jgi:lysyl-tRNA synthetase class 2